ncbi:ATP-dependent DNA ligase [Devosia oryziradicis]|uniref:DNA ligase (ATP) n=1 Tax=Devosia oryziradicis TaxID=2801335 RepID=A0ABX7BZD9_9HYPH|nr:ATP-dependent DNA ligase [Devosia oryziradicis]QQR37191.1 ATP-dependent DNA ligase [Devosia oryziradicis]
MPKLTFVPPMEAKSVADLPKDEGWQFEPKWDGFRCLACKQAGQVDLWAKSGKPLGRYFPEMVELVGALPGDTVMLDGELIVPIDGVASFDALQARLHPAASRVKKLAGETPALLVVFDLLDLDGESWLDKPLRARRAALERYVKDVGSDRLRLSPITADAAQARHWLEGLSTELDGVIAKRSDDPYASSERAMRKIKRIRSADCVVGGFRYGTDSDQVGSLLLGLYDEQGKLDHVGFTSAIAAKDKPDLTRRLEALKGGPGFTGKAPGGPSRWSTERSAEWVPLRPELVVEVLYDQVTSRRFRHGTRLHRWRPDKAPSQCTFDQMAQPAAPDQVIGAVLTKAAGRRQKTH